MIAELKYINNSIGVDEAGRGAWAGPVVAAAVYLFPDHKIIGLNDSKKLSPRNREVLFEKICSNHKYGIGLATTEEIDDINILQATFLAMKRAIGNLNYQPTSPNDHLTYLIDGNINPNLGVNSKAIIKGDSLFESIAAASIIAKVTRDKIMTELDNSFPGYKWNSNAGYGTADHLNSLIKLGVNKHHRKSYKPIANLLTIAAKNDIIIVQEV